MVKAVNLGGRMVSLESNAGTAIIYKRVFKRDLIRDMAKINVEQKDEMLELVEMLQQLAFIMAKQGESTPLDKLLALSDADYITWLCGFEPGTFDRADTINEIVSIWRNQSIPTSEQKN